MQSTPRSRRHAVRAAVVLIASSLTSPALAQATASWLGPVDGQWLDKSRWSTSPGAYPRNTPSQTYQVLIDATGNPYTVTLGDWGGNVLNLTVDSLTLNSPDATLVVASGNLRSLTPIQINAGRLLLATAYADSPAVLTGTVAPGAGSFEGYTGILDALLLQRQFNVLGSYHVGTGVVVRNGLTLDGGSLSLQAQISYSSNITFSGTQTLAGSGDVRFATLSSNGIYAAGGTLTIDPGITLRTDNGRGGLAAINGTIINDGVVRAQGANQSILITAADSGPNTFVNQNLIEATTGASISISGQFSNAGGTVRSDGGIVFLGDAHVGAPTYTTADLGTLRAVNGGQIVLGGSLNNAGATLTASDASGTLTLGTITVTGGTLATSGAAAFRSYSFNATLDSVTLAGAFTGGASVRNGLSLNGATITTTTGGLLAFGTQSITGSGSIFFDSPSGAAISLNTAGTLTLGPGITLETAGGSGTITGYAPGAAVVSAATLLSQNAGQSLTLSNFTNNGQILISNGGSVTTAGDFTNNGSISVTNAGVLTLRDNWSSSVGTITMADAQVNFGGTFTPAALAHFSRSSGAVYLDGTLDNTGTTFPLNAVTGSWKMAGGSKILNGTVAASDGRLLTVVGNAELSGVTLATPVLVNYGNLTLSNNTSLSSGGSIALAPVDTSRQMILQVNSPTLSGTGDVVFDNATQYGPAHVTGLATGLTLAPGITVRTGTGNGNVGDTSSPLTNQGTLSARTPGTLLGAVASNLTNSGTAEAINGATLNLSAAGTLSNTGTIAAGNGGTVNLNAAWTNSGVIAADNATVNLGGTFTPTSIGSVSVSNNGALNVTGYLDAASTPLILSAALPLGLAGGTITGTINSADATPLLARKNASRLSSVIVNAPVSVLPGATLNTVAATLNQPVTVTGGGTLSLAGAWSNNSSITATGNSTVALSSTTPATLGTISLTDSTLRITSSTLYTTALLRPVSLTNSKIAIGFNAFLDNTGDTLALSPTTATLILGPGGVKGGTISGPAGVPVVFSSGATTASLNGVTVAADVNVVPSSSLSFTNGLTLDHSHISLTPGLIGPTITSASLLASGTQTLGGTGTITFDGANGATSAAVVRPSLGTLTIGPDVTIRTGTNSGFVGLSTVSLPLILNGTVSAETAGTTVTVFGNPLTNNGLLQASNWATLAVTALSFTNAGTITVAPSATLLLTSGSAVPNGTIRLSGTGILNYTGATVADAVRLQLATGRDGATGIILPEAAADPTRAIGYIEASALLNLTGSQTTTDAGQTVDATTLLLKPTFFGDANFDGRVNADDYAILDRAFAEDLTNARWTDGDFDYSGVIDAADYLLIDTTLASQAPLSPDFLSMREAQFGPEYVRQLIAAVPEPSTIALASLMLPVASRRRRR